MNPFGVGRWALSVGRFLALKIAISILLLTGCASAPHNAPRFTEPSTAPIRKAIATAKSKVESAKQKTVVIGEECPQAKAMVYALTQDLDGATAELSTAEGARDQLQAELTREIKQANELANDYDKAGAQITLLKESRHGWVKRFWMASAALLVCGIWIFRRPLLAMLGGFAGGI